MSVAQARGVYKSTQEREYYNVVLSTFPQETQKLWREYIKIPHWDKMPSKTDLKIVALCMVVYFFFRGKLISVKKAEKLFIEFMNHSNEKYKEFSQKKEILEVIDTFQRNSIRWN